MKKRKTLVSVILASMLALALCLTACGGDNYSETFNGAVSETTYVSVDASVSGFLEEELSGQASQAVLVKYETKEELPAQKAVQDLGLQAKDAEGLSKAEKIEVEYEEQAVTAKAASSLAAAQESTPKVVKRIRIVFVLVYVNGSCRYYVPKVEVGETLAASYFDSVFDGSNYVNCTQKASGTVTASGMTEKIDSTVKCTEEAMYVPSIGGSPEMYVLQTGKGLRAVAKSASGWIVNKDYDYIFGTFDTIGDYMLWSFDLQFGGFDHTCFEKTATGYVLKEGMGKFWYQRVLEQFMPSGVPEMPSLDEMMQYFTKLDMGMEIYVSEGRISKLNMTLDMEMNVMGYTIGIKEDETCEFSDFGTTKVNVPAEVKALVS